MTSTWHINKIVLHSSVITIDATWISQIISSFQFKSQSLEPLGQEQYCSRGKSAVLFGLPPRILRQKPLLKSEQDNLLMWTKPNHTRDLHLGLVVVLVLVFSLVSSNSLTGKSVRFDLSTTASCDDVLAAVETLYLQESNNLTLHITFKAIRTGSQLTMWYVKKSPHAFIIYLWPLSAICWWYILAAFSSFSTPYIRAGTVEFLGFPNFDYGCCWFPTLPLSIATSYPPFFLSVPGKTGSWSVSRCPFVYSLFNEMCKEDFNSLVWWLMNQNGTNSQYKDSIVVFRLGKKGHSFLDIMWPFIHLKVCLIVI